MDPKQRKEQRFGENLKPSVVDDRFQARIHLFQPILVLGPRVHVHGLPTHNGRFNAERARRLTVRARDIRFGDDRLGILRKQKSCEEILILYADSRCRWLLWLFNAAERHALEFRRGIVDRLFLLWIIGQGLIAKARLPDEPI